MPRISVYVMDYGRTFYQLQWVDPTTGQRRTKSAKTKNRREAERKALELEDELNSGHFASDGSMAWEEFRDQLQRLYLSGLAVSTRLHVNSILNRLEASIRESDSPTSTRPHYLSDVTAADLSNHVAWMRELGRSEDTIKNHLRHIRAVLQWAVEQNWLRAIPNIPKVRRGRKSKEMKGRPISDQEFQQMLKAVPEIVGQDRSDSWVHLLRGLWLSGLRLREALALKWDGDGIRVVLGSNGKPRLRIPGDAQKSKEDQLYPLPRSFREFLLQVPKARRTGFVFHPSSTQGRQNNPYDVGRIISEIGKAAKVTVDSTTKGHNTKAKYASAHDLRRSFGSRWSLKVMPVTLQKLMRHSHISTTMKYYVDHEVADTERLLDGME